MNIIKGVIISLITTMIFLFIFSIVLTYTNVSESFTTPVIIVITAISILIGSSIGNFKASRNGLLWSNNRRNIFIKFVCVIWTYLSKLWINNDINNSYYIRNDMWNVRRYYRSKQGLKKYAKNS